MGEFREVILADTLAVTSTTEKELELPAQMGILTDLNVKCPLAAANRRIISRSS